MPVDATGAVDTSWGDHGVVDSTSPEWPASVGPQLLTFPPTAVLRDDGWIIMNLRRAWLHVSPDRRTQGAVTRTTRWGQLGTAHRCPEETRSFGRAVDSLCNRHGAAHDVMGDRPRSRRVRLMAPTSPMPPGMRSTHSSPNRHGRARCLVQARLRGACPRCGRAAQRLAGVGHRARRADPRGRQLRRR